MSNKGGRPKKKKSAGIKDPSPAITGTREQPRFCLTYLSEDYCVERLEQKGQARFARALRSRSKMTWNQITFADRHGLGSETLPAKDIKPALPPRFRDSEKVLVLRYDDRLPMVGVRVGDTFHVLFIEKKYGDLYDHGS